jgi:type VI secretion system secreted protein Hcp
MAVDMFLKIGDIKGEARDAKHKQEIDVLSWNWGMSQTGSMHVGGGGGSGKVNVQNLTVTKWVDKATPTLMKYCCNGKQMKDAVLVVRKAGEKPLEYVTIKMENVIITSITSDVTGGEDKLTEKVILNFAKFHYEYQPQKDDGSKDGGAIPMQWNIKANAEK